MAENVGGLDVHRRQTPPTPINQPENTVPDQADRFAEAIDEFTARRARKAAVRREFKVARDAGLRLRHTAKLRRGGERR